MNAASDRTPEVRRPVAREVVVGFSPESVKAPFLLRCGALMIDYMIVIAIPVVGLLLSRLSGNDGARLLNDSLNNAGWLIAFVAALLNLILLPLFSGQTLGKILTGLRIVALDGSMPTLRAVAIRQTLGYALTILTVGAGFLLSVFGRRGRALHDYVAGTMVIYADRRVRK